MTTPTTENTIERALNKFAVSAQDFDIDKFNDVVKDVRHTRKQVVEFGSDFEETTERLKEAEAALKAAMSNLELDTITKVAAEVKRLRAKLETTPVTKIQAYDEAMDKLHAFFAAFFAAGCTVEPKKTESQQTDKAA